MNYSKLNELAAKAMGWIPQQIDDGHSLPCWMDSATGEHEHCHSKWNPSTCADDALLLLESVAQGKGYSIYMFPEHKKPYDVELEVYKVCTDERTLPLAMTVCALRAAGIPESEITAAME